MRPDPGLSRVRILLVEDSADDAELIAFALRNAPFSFDLARVEAEDEFVAALDTTPLEVILCDYHLPRFSMPRALHLVRAERGLETPFIVVSRLIGEEAAVEAMQKGADDYLLKGRLGRLPAAIAAALERVRARREQAAADEALRRSDLLNRSLLSSLSMRIAVLDADGAIVQANRAWERHAAAHSGEAASLAIGANFLAHLAAIDDPSGAAAQARAGTEAVIAHREPRFGIEYQLPPGPVARWELLRAEPLEDRGRGAVVSIEDITARMLMNLALQGANRRLQELSRRLLSVQEDEHRAIALELHDDIGQSLAALKIALHAEVAARPDGDAQALRQCLAVAEETIEKLRRLSYSLRPPQLDQFGLEGALRALAEQQQRSTGIAVACRVLNLDRRPPPAIEMACYRIAQEALNNATRHARPTQVVIEVERRELTLRLAVRDNGQGFDERQAREQAGRRGSLGLAGMAERAELAGGKLKVRSVPHSGTTVVATFVVEPLAATQP